MMNNSTSNNMKQKNNTKNFSNPMVNTWNR